MHAMTSILADAAPGSSLWQEYVSITLDPAHIGAELTFTLLFDLLIVSLLWGLIFKKMILPRIKRDVHAEIDREHGYKHKDEDQS